MRSWLALAAVFFLALPVRAELTADDVVILANSNLPESIEVAEHYAERRGIDPSRICAIPMPIEEQIGYAAFHNDVAPAFRIWLMSNGLVEQASCVVTVYGVPLKINDRPAAPTDDAERDEIRLLTSEIKARLETAVKLAEDVAGITDGRGESIDQLRRRLQTAAERAQEALKTDPAVAQRWAAVQTELAKPIVPDGWEAPALPADPQGTIDALAARPADAEARRELRNLLRAAGPLGLDPLLRLHNVALQTEQTHAEFTSELACLWWGGYPKQRWQANPLAFNHRGASPRTLMTARLDGKSAEQAKRLVDMAMAVESVGLRGNIVIDSRGIDARKPDGSVDSYGIYDETLRLLSLSLHDKPNVFFDDQPDVIPAGTYQGVAVYVGWYSVRKYVAGMEFLPGAVGFHIASFEMLTLRNPSTSWVPNLLDAGVISTLGPVAEPYLSSFPKAHDFVLLTLTGKLTMGEVYWATNPMVSWQVGFVGDPLYTPFALTPVLTPEELPKHLHDVVANPKSQ